MDNALRLARGVAGMLRTHYPNFALGLPLKRNEIPVFIYHDVEPETFADDLEFLRSNNYETLSLEDFMRRSDGNGPSSKSVLITFDDARKSFYDAALPVLRSYGAHATLFAPTYWMDPTQANQAGANDLFMSWEQLRSCVESGLVDVQSHAHRHALVFHSSRVVDFANVEALRLYHIYDWPMRNVDTVDQLGGPALGSPIYRAAPLLSARGRYLENSDLTRACVEFVAQRGGAEFFVRSDWAQQLRQFHEANCAKMPGRYQSEAEFRALVASEFEQSRAAFQKNLGYAPTYLAYPWMLGSALSLELARDFGIRVTFGVALDYGRAKDRRLPVRTFGRLQKEWLPALPGRGRSSIFSIAARKISGFSKTLHLAH